MSITRCLAVATVIASGAMPLAANAGTFTTLYTFKGGMNGGPPYGGALTYVNGEVYGVASSSADPSFYGAVYKVNAKSGSYNLVHAFVGGSDGIDPEAGVIYYNGLIYGTTLHGGGSGCVFDDITYGCGTIFSIDPATETETVLYEFSQVPNVYWAVPGSFVETGGTLFAPTLQGGSDGNGSVISYTPSTGTFSTLYSFSGGADGRNPNLQILLQDGLLYGTTVDGGKGCDHRGQCGVVFSVDPSTGMETVVHAFASNAGGRNPLSNLAYEGKSLFGDTLTGGNKQYNKRGSGVGFQIKASTGHEKVLATFPSGQQQYFGITIVGGSAYEVLPYGGNGNGELLQVDLKTGVQTVLYDFTGGTDGSDPRAQLIYHGGAFYGTTDGGNGTVFKYVP